MALEGFDEFSAQNPPHTYSLIKDPDAKYSPLGENTTLTIQEEWPLRGLMSFPLDILHTPIVLSPDPEARYSPLGENTTLKTEEEWP